MAQLPLRAGIACCVAGAITTLVGVAAVLDAPVPSLSTVAAVAVAAGLVSAAILPWRFDLRFDPRTESHPLGVSLVAGLLGGFAAPVAPLFVEAPFLVDTLLVFGGLTTLLGASVTVARTQRAWIADRRAAEQRVVDLDSGRWSRWQRGLGLIFSICVLVVLVGAVRDRSYATVALFGHAGVWLATSHLWPHREAVFETGLLESSGGVATFAEWDAFDGYTIDGETLRLRRGRNETTVDLSCADDPDVVRSIVADHLPAD